MDNKNSGKFNPHRTPKGGESNSSDVQHQPIQAKPLEVVVFNSFDKAMRAFRAQVQKERILSSYKDKQSYEKPSDKKRRKRNEMKRKRFELENTPEFSERKRKPKKEKPDSVPTTES